RVGIPRHRNWTNRIYRSWHGCVALHIFDGPSVGTTSTRNAVRTSESSRWTVMVAVDNTSVIPFAFESSHGRRKHSEVFQLQNELLDAATNPRNRAHLGRTRIPGHHKCILQRGDLLRSGAMHLEFTQILPGSFPVG
ncbi:hypothetical protein M758_4G262500, partial [Ceratodon purpureus]